MLASQDAPMKASPVPSVRASLIFEQRLETAGSEAIDKQFLACAPTLHPLAGQFLAGPLISAKSAKVYVQHHNHLRAVCLTSCQALFLSSLIGVLELQRLLPYVDCVVVL